MPETENEIIEALKMDSGTVPASEGLDPADSPLNYPVKEKDIAGAGSFQSHGPPPTDAPEQKIGDTPEEETFEIPKEQAAMMAEMFIGAANNVIEVGGGFFVKIKKHKEFQEYEELIQVIDEQNEKNIKRLKLDEEDKAMLRPLLTVILQKRAKILSPEEQLAIALFTILIKKAQIVFEMRSENKLLEERMKEIIKGEKAYQKPASFQQEPEVENESQPDDLGSEQAEEAEELEVEEVFAPKNGPGVVRASSFQPTEEDNSKRLDSSQSKKPAT